MVELIPLLKEEIQRVSVEVPNIKARRNGHNTALFLTHDLQRAQKAIEEANETNIKNAYERLKSYRFPDSEPAAKEVNALTDV